MSHLTFNQDTAQKFAQAYNTAKKTGQEIFIYEGHEILVSYAYYLIQHLCNEKILTGIFNAEKIFTVTKNPHLN